ncbi:hypothetical protein CL628_04090 [bacterium]|nr:hypothetical protein [bacterium]
MKQRAIIVHCWEGTPEYCWYPWVKQQLETAGFTVDVPAFPHTEAPTQADWVPFLSQSVGRPDKDLVLIGHSVGVITILRYLETLTTDQAIGAAVFVAGFTDDLGYTELANYFTTPLQYPTYREHCDRFVGIFSDDDPHVPVAQADIFREKLNAEIIVKEKMGHFSGPVDDESSCRQLPEVVLAVEGK